MKRKIGREGLLIFIHHTITHPTTKHLSTVHMVNEITYLKLISLGKEYIYSTSVEKY